MRSKWGLTRRPPQSVTTDRVRLGQLHPALVVAGRSGLPGQHESVAVALSSEDFAPLLQPIVTDRLAGLLCDAIDDKLVVAPAAVHYRLIDFWHKQLASSVRAESTLLEAAELLDGAGVPWRVTKGPAIAHLDFEDPGLRTFGDLDLLIHPVGWEVGIAALIEGGWRRRTPAIAGDFEDRFGKGITLTDATGAEIDAHRRLAIGRFGLRLPTETLFDEPETIVIGGRAVPAPSGSSRLIHACFHAVLGGTSLVRSRRDIAQLLLASDVDWQRAIEVARDAAVDAVLARGVLSTWHRLALRQEHEMVEWARAQHPGLGDRYAIKVFAEERSFAQQALTAVPELIGHGALLYLWQLGIKPARIRLPLSRSDAQSRVQ